MQGVPIGKDSNITRIQDSSKWDWVPANQILETSINNNKSLIETKPSIVLTHPEGDQYPEPYVTLVIDTEKQLKYSEELGWNWHKSWNLPNIVVRLEIKDSQTQELLLSPKNLYAQLFAVKKLQDQSRAQLIDVGLRGTSKIELIDGQAYFSALRFASTSYNNEGVKFHLLMCVYIQNADQEKPQILNSTISPPIFVDSRKSAGNSEQKKLFLYAEPFTLDLLDKKYFKRENKKKTEQDIEIENDFESLFNYLTAPNIRHKVKHPLFLVIKFSQCVSLYYNTQTLTTDIKLTLEKLQNCLSKDIIAAKTDYSVKPITQSEKLFYLLIEESPDLNKNKKILEAIDFLSTPNLEIIRKPDQLPENFAKIGETQDILESYKLIFDSLIKIFKSHAQKFESDSNESDEYSESEPQSIKKVKIQSDNPQDAIIIKAATQIVPKKEVSIEQRETPHISSFKPKIEIPPPPPPSSSPVEPSSVAPQISQLQQPQSQQSVQKPKIEKKQKEKEQHQKQPSKIMNEQQHQFNMPQQQQQQQQPFNQMLQQQQELFQQMLMGQNPLLNPFMMMQQQMLGQNPQQQYSSQSQQQQQSQQYAQQLAQASYLQYIAQQAGQGQQRGNQMMGLQNLMGMGLLGQQPGQQQGQLGQQGQQQFGQLGQLGPQQINQLNQQLSQQQMGLLGQLNNQQGQNPMLNPNLLAQLSAGNFQQQYNPFGQQQQVPGMRMGGFDQSQLFQQLGFIPGMMNPIPQQSQQPTNKKNEKKDIKEELQ